MLNKYTFCNKHVYQFVKLSKNIYGVFIITYLIMFTVFEDSYNTKHKCLFKNYDKSN